MTSACLPTALKCLKMPSQPTKSRKRPASRARKTPKCIGTSVTIQLRYRRTRKALRLTISLATRLLLRPMKTVLSNLSPSIVEVAPPLCQRILVTTRQTSLNQAKRLESGMVVTLRCGRATKAGNRQMLSRPPKVKQIQITSVSSCSIN